MKISRKELLQKLLCVAPGLAKGKDMVQSDCIVLRKGRMYTLRQEIACSLVSDLESEIEGAVRAEKLISVLKLMASEDVEVTVTDKVFEVKSGKGRKLTIPMEEDVLLPIGQVERPKDWVSLDEDFTEAVDLTWRCVKKGGDFPKDCVHITPGFVEGCDDSQLIRYTVPTFVKKSALVRGESIKVIAQLGMTKGCETANWLHFHSPVGLRLSVRKFSEDHYPRFDEYLAKRGKKVKLPKRLQIAAEAAGHFVEDGFVTVELTGGELRVVGRSQDGRYEETNPVKYDGPDLKFRVPFKVLISMMERHSIVEVTTSSFRVDGGGKYVFVTELQMEEKI